MKQERLNAEDLVLSREQQCQLLVLAGLVRQTLLTALQLGTVVIVTNSEEGWPEES